MKSTEELFNEYLNLPEDMQIQELTKQNLELLAERDDLDLENAILSELMDKYVQVNKQLNEQVELITKLSETDPLTGAYNRSKFNVELEREILRHNRYKTPMSMVMLDIDFFKKINDAYGHDVGDKVLISLVKILDAEIRNIDLLARWGGEEFVLILPNTPGDMAQMVADRIRRKIAIYDFEQVGSITCSFGVAEMTRGMNSDDLIKEADDCLYYAKTHGRNQVRYNKLLDFDMNLDIDETD